MFLVVFLKVILTRIPERLSAIEWVLVGFVCALVCEELRQVNMVENLLFENKIFHFCPD